MNLRFCRELKGLLQDFEDLTMLRAALEYGGTIEMEILVQTGSDTPTRYCVHDRKLIGSFRNLLDTYIYKTEQDITGSIEYAQETNYER